MSVFKKIVIGALTAATLMASATAAFAASAQATANVNVRSGPGTGYGVVDVLINGETVEVTECAENGWCYVEHNGPDGWVSGNYLAASGGGSSGGSSDPNCSFGFNLGGAGPSLSINCGDSSVNVSPPAPPAPPPPVGNEACFYTGLNYTGSEYCTGPVTRNTLNATFNDKISSVKLFGAAKARLCVNQNLGGFCNVFESDTNLGPFLNDKASSLQVFTGPIILPVPPVVVIPTTFSTGPIALQQTWRANLDTGSLGNPGSDIWYEAVNPVQKFITPVNGAKIALGDGSNRGYAGCSTETFSSAKVSIWDMPVGTYVCVKTNQGRVSQFRLNGYTGTTMNIGYTTWAN